LYYENFLNACCERACNYADRQATANADTNLHLKDRQVYLFIRCLKTAGAAYAAGYTVQCYLSAASAAAASFAC